MKTCPRCKMTNTGHSQCPICNEDISDVPYEEKGTPIRYVLNKYFFLYLLKYHKVCVLSWIGTIFFIIARLPDFDWKTLGILLGLLYSFIIVLFPNVLAAMGGGPEDPDFNIERMRPSARFFAVCMFILSICYYILSAFY